MKLVLRKETARESRVICLNYYRAQPQEEYEILVFEAKFLIPRTGIFFYGRFSIDEDGKDFQFQEGMSFYKDVHESALKISCFIAIEKLMLKSEMMDGEDEFFMHPLTEYPFDVSDSFSTDELRYILQEREKRKRKEEEE